MTNLTEEQQKAAAKKAAKKERVKRRGAIVQSHASDKTDEAGNIPVKTVRVTEKVMPKNFDPRKDLPKPKRSK